MNITYFSIVTAGKNVLQRNSKDFNSVVPDQYSVKTLMKMVDGALEDKNNFYVQKVRCQKTKNP